MNNALKWNEYHNLNTTMEFDWMMEDLPVTDPVKTKKEKSIRRQINAKNRQEHRDMIFRAPHSIYKGWSNYRGKMTDKCVCGRRHVKDTVQVSCGHVFGYSCILNYIKTQAHLKKECPICQECLI